MNLGLQGKLAVVSGSTAGIGLAIVTALAVEGATVVVNGRTEARVAEALEKIRNRVSGANLRGVAADLGTATGVDAFLKQAPDADVGSANGADGSADGSRQTNRGSAHGGRQTNRADRASRGYDPSGDVERRQRRLSQWRSKNGRWSV